MANGKSQMTKPHVKCEMFISEAVAYGRARLPTLEAEILLCFILQISHEYLITHPEREINTELVLEFQKYCEARVSGIPLAYLTHHKEFFGLDFYVDERVFIPRPETELLVEEAMTCITSNNILLCDIGTGSGCIAISLAKKLPHVSFVAVDISEGALEVARKNAEFHGVSSQIEFMKSDLLSNVIARSTLGRPKQSTFDGIVANLPYIGTLENHLVSREVLEHEPKEALFSGETGLELYERLFAQICAFRQTQGDKAPKWLIGEMGFLQQEALEKLIHTYFGNISVNFKDDLSGLPRVFSIFFNRSASLPAGRRGARRDVLKT